MLKRMTSSEGLSLRHCALVAQLYLEKYRSGSEQLATLFPIRGARHLNLRAKKRHYEKKNVF